MRTGVRTLLLFVLLGAAASASELTVSTPVPATGTVLPPQLSVPYAETDRLRGPAMRTRPCSGTPGSFTFTVLEDGRVQMRRSFDAPAQGEHQERPPRETAWGTWDGARLVLRGEHDGGGFHKHANPPVTYELRWEADVAHLAGTRNNVPIRLAPLEIRKGDCRDSPPAPVPTPSKTATPRPTPDPGTDPTDCPRSECKGPSMGMPNWECTDGRTGGPACKRLPDGTCGWVVVDCPPLQR
jgi:hypothetical protein